ncbi:MAG TPA: hypothetical protein VJJ22_03585 [Candidatus Paceibacterota bacterium]
MLALGWIALLVVTYLLNGAALMLLWGWFMVPTFSLPSLSLSQAIGVGIVISFLAQPYIPKDEDGRNESIVHDIIVPFLATLIGWIVHQFM